MRNYHLAIINGFSGYIVLTEDVGHLVRSILAFLVRRKIHSFIRSYIVVCTHNVIAVS